MNQQKSNGANNGKDQLVENLYRSAAQNNRIEPYLFDYYDDILADVGEELGIDFGRKCMQLGDIKKVLGATKKV